jgi:hypothetical protein
MDEAYLSDFAVQLEKDVQFFNTLSFLSQVIRGKFHTLG